MAFVGGAGYHHGVSVKTLHRSWCTLPILSALAIMAAPSSAQQRMPPDDPIVVTGREAPDLERIRSLARSIAPQTGYNQPFARFADPVCFAVAGLSASWLVTVANRLVDDAQQAGIRTAGADCQPNVILMFVGDGGIAARRLLNKRPDIFRDSSLPEVRRIIDEPGPVRVITGTVIRSRDGDRMEHVAPDEVPVLKVSTASAISPPIRRDITSSVVLIDRAAIAGLGLVQIADYAAMRSLAMARPVDVDRDDTILGLFTGRSKAPPAEMTAFDRGYLKTLYSGTADERAFIKLGRIIRYIHGSASEDADRGARINR